MSAPRIILASLPSFCQKLSKLVKIWRSSDKNNFAQVLLDTVYMSCYMCVYVSMYVFATSSSETCGQCVPAQYRDFDDVVMETVGRR